MKSKMEKEFIEAFDKHADAIYRYLFFRLGNNKELAKDLMQQTYVKTWSYLYDGNIIDNLRAFLYKTATNLIIDNKRHQKRIKEESIDDMNENLFIDHQSEKLYDQIDAKLAYQTIEKIDDIYKEVLILRYLDGYRPKEISKILNVSENVVSVRINRGLKQIREILNKKDKLYEKSI